MTQGGSSEDERDLDASHFQIQVSPVSGSRSPIGRELVELMATTARQRMITGKVVIEFRPEHTKREASV